MFDMKALRVVLAAGAGLACLYADAYTYWNGTRYVERRSAPMSVGSRDSYEQAAAYVASVSPDDFEDKEEFLKAYYEQELDCLTAAQRNEDRRTLGGVSSRKMRIRRVGERLWKESRESKAASQAAKNSDQTFPQEDLSQYLKGRPLMGLFGMELGSTIDPQGYERVGTSNTYIFQPKKTFRGYKRYVISITPISHKVYGIRASDFSFAADPSVVGQRTIKDEWEATKNALEKRFEKKAKMEIGTMVCPNFKLLFPGKGKSVERVVEVVFGSSITAVDLKLKQIAEEEADITKRKTIDENIQEDVDAL